MVSRWVGRPNRPGDGRFNVQDRTLVGSNLMHPLQPGAPRPRSVNSGYPSMKRDLCFVSVTRSLLLFCSLAAAHAAQSPTLVNTNTVNNGRGAPPMTAEESVANLTKVP